MLVSYGGYFSRERETVLCMPRKRKWTVLSAVVFSCWRPLTGRDRMGWGEGLPLTDSLEWTLQQLLTLWSPFWGLLLVKKRGFALLFVYLAMHYSYSILPPSSGDWIFYGNVDCGYRTSLSVVWYFLGMSTLYDFKKISLNFSTYLLIGGWARHRAHVEVETIQSSWISCSFKLSLSHFLQAPFAPGPSHQTQYFILKIKWINLFCRLEFPSPYWQNLTSGFKRNIWITTYFGFGSRVHFLWLFYSVAAATVSRLRQPWSP